MSRILLLLCALSFASTETSSAQNHWKELGRQTDHILFRLSFLDSLRGWVAGFNGTILRTTNGGMSWEMQEPGVSTNIHEVFALNDHLVWALSFEQFIDTNTWFGTNILKTTDGGATWSHEKFPQAGEFFNAIMFQDSLNGWMGGEFGHLVRTSDGGETWTPAQVDSSIYARWAIIRIKFFTPSYGYAMGGRIDIAGSVWRTTNAGATWESSGPSPEPVHDIHVIDSLHLVAITGDVDYGASMMRSTDAGENWDWTFLNIFGEPQAMSFRTDREAWVPLGFAAQLMYTKDTARTWTTLNTPERRPIYDLVFTDSITGYAVGDSGTILKYTPSALDVVPAALEPPGAFTLHQNYPNPFNPATTISFDLPRRSFVNLAVYNILGEEVTTLLQQDKEPGRHLVGFQAGDLPSGVYFYRLRAGNRLDVKKMLLLR